MKSRNGARPYDAIPFIPDSAELGIAVAKWWNKMQPTFRRGTGNIPMAIYDVDDGSVWDPLRKSGPNGIVSVLTLLVWWGQAIQDRTQYQTDSSAEWRAIILDVTACMSSILATTNMARNAKKRKGKTVRNEKSAKRYVFSYVWVHDFF